MKKITFLICLLTITLATFAQNVTPSLISSGLVRAGGCASTYVGNPMIDNTCFAGIQRQIARNVAANGLVELIYPKTCYGYVPAGATVYDVNNIPAPDVEVNCVKPYDRCYTRYCPNKYSEAIKSFITLKASMISRVVDIWGNQGEVIPGSLFYNKLKQVVIDVNAAYDCAGLRRPVIQGTILEHFNQEAASVPIPCEIITAFANEIPILHRSIYLDANGNCRNVNFSSSRLAFGPGHHINSPDITKIEAKMWFYYLAKMYIDFGYTSIHMGQFNIWSGNDPDYVHTKAILTKIRNYAASKGSFILLTNESKIPYKFPGTATFIFDYGSQVLWPTEQPGAGPSLPCSNPTGNYLAGTPCANDPFKAVIDNCVISHNPNAAGFSPLNGCFMPYLPFTTFFDFGMENITQPPGVATANPPQLVWGWEDTKWFTTKITPACRSYWLNDAICRMRTYNNGFGYMYIPALIPLPMPENRGKHDSAINPTADGVYFMADEPAVLEAVKNKLTPPASLGINIVEQCTGNLGPCFDAGLFKVKQQKYYRLSVVGGDCITTKTWHIKNPDGSWQPFSNGDSRDFYPPQDGIYTIYLRRDDLSWPATNGSFTYERTGAFSVYMTTTCCAFPRLFNQTVNENKEAVPGAVDKDFEDYIKNRKYYYSDTSGVKFGYSGSELTGSDKSNNPHISFSVYPNPASESVTILLEDGFQQEHITIQIIDALGRMVNQKSITGGEHIKKDILMDISELPVGIYLIKVNNAVKKMVKK